MKKSTELQTMKHFVDTLTKEEAERLVRKVMGSPRKIIVGEEYEKIMTMIRLMEPIGGSNNQVIEEEIYRIGDQENYTEYRITYFPTGELELVEMLEEENE